MALKRSWTAAAWDAGSGVAAGAGLGFGAAVAAGF